jgi:hypothetical protein
LPDLEKLGYELFQSNLEVMPVALDSRDFRTPSKRKMAAPGGYWRQLAAGGGGLDEVGTLPKKPVLSFAKAKAESGNS